MSQTIEKLKTQAQKLPDTPGVYLFADAHGKILYVGKAASLKSRVASYFSSELKSSRGSRIAALLNRAHKISYEKTDSVLEALMRESFLIKTHKPPYNIKEKDDKSYLKVVITKEEYPRILLVRERDIEKRNLSTTIVKSFGPFTEGTKIKEALKIIRSIIPYRDTCMPFNIAKNKKARPCFNASIGLCPGVCTGAIDAKTYKKSIKHIEHILAGSTKKAVAALKRDMSMYAKKMQFEQAEKVKRQIFALEHIRDMSLISEDSIRSIRERPRLEAFDIAHTAGKETVGVMVVSFGGEVAPAEYRTFKIKTVGNNDPAALKELLERRLNHDEWSYPVCMIADGGKVQLNVLKSAIAQLPISTIAVTKDEHHKPLKIIGDAYSRQGIEEKWILNLNAEAHRFAINFHRRRLRKSSLK